MVDITEIMTTNADARLLARVVAERGGGQKGPLADIGRGGPLQLALDKSII